VPRRKTDADTGITPKALDGDPDSELQAEMDAQAVRRSNGRSIDDHEIGEEDDGQLFSYEPGQRVTLGSLIPRGTPVEHAFLFTGQRRKGAEELIGFDEDVLLVVRGKVGKVAPVVTRNDDESVKSVTIETTIVPKVIVAADSAQAMDMLAAVIDKRAATSGI
jgi:hypothetical protein